MKNKFGIFSVLSAILFFFSTTGFAQDPAVDLDKKVSFKVRPIRIGVKIGFPNLIGGNLEYVTPLLGKKLAVNADYSMLKSDWLVTSEDMEEDNQDKINYTYLDLGLNYYIFKPGNGLYTGISYSTIKAESTRETMDGVEFIKEKHNSFNVKLGAKLGGLFYFRPEVGYSFNPLPKKYDVLLVNNDGTRETRTDDWGELESAADIFFNGLVANIGFGFAF